MCANGPLHFPEDCVTLAEYLPKSTPTSCAIYNTTNKPKTRTPVQSTCFYLYYFFLRNLRKGNSFFYFLNIINSKE